MKNDVFSQLAAAGALTHRLAATRKEVPLRGVEHGSLRVVHGAGGHSDERHRHIVGYLIDRLFRPFHLFQSMYAFEIDDVGIGALQTGRLIYTVVVEQ